MKRLTTALAALSLTLLLAGCGDDGDDPADADGQPSTQSTADDGTDADDAADPGDAGAGDVPEACRTPFPQAFAPADLADVELLPAGFPEPPVEATLCITAETVGGAHETASYATPATAEEVLAGYESALASFGATRDQDGIGRAIITANDGALVIQVTPQDGGFVLAFAR